MLHRPSPRHLAQLFDLTVPELHEVLHVAFGLKRALLAGRRTPILPGRMMALLFEKPSLRTRVSFETGMAQLGGQTMVLGEEAGWGKRESPADFTRVLSRYVDVIVCRSKKHSTVTTLAQYATCPVINGLTDLSHPCQAIADFFTILESQRSDDPASLADVTLCYLGDGNNVARSLAVCSAMLGARMVICSPPGYELPATERHQILARYPHARIEQTDNIRQAVTGAQFLYTDVWASMGQEAERETRRMAFADYQVSEAVMEMAGPDAKFLHCLPARRGEEVTDGVMDSPNSLIIDQAENRMHAQKGLVVWLMMQSDPAIRDAAESLIGDRG